MNIRFSQVRGVSRSTISEAAPRAGLAQLALRQVRLTKRHPPIASNTSAEGAERCCRAVSVDTSTRNACEQTSESAFGPGGAKSKNASSDGSREWNARVAEISKGIAIRA